MAKPDHLLGAAISAVRAGLSGRAGLRALRSAGRKVTDSVWYGMIGAVRNNIADRIDEAGRPLNRRPTGNEITTLPSRSRSGFWQEVEVFWRDRTTGEIGSSPFVLRSSGLVTRQAAITFAVGEWAAGSSGTPNPDDHEVLGAAYTSTIELRPESGA